MTILKTSGWADYELLDSGNSLRIERFGKYVIQRPDPQAIWKLSSGTQKADAIYDEKWIAKNVPAKWELSYENIKFSKAKTKSSVAISWSYFPFTASNNQTNTYVK